MITTFFGHMASFLWRIVTFCEKKKIEKIIFCQNFPVLKKIIETKMKKNLQKIATMAYNMQMCLRFST
jgi:hypothetical protein